MDITNLLTYVEVFEGVEVGMVSLEFMIVVVLLATLKLFGRVEDDEATCPIPQSQEGACGVELKGSDVVLL